MFGLSTSIKLPIKFDVDRLQRDLAALDRFELITHPLEYHDGRWKLLALVAPGGRSDFLHDGKAGYGAEPPAKTEILKNAPYFEEVLDWFPAEVLRARVSVLPPGARVLRHYDPVESIDFGVLRLHVPVVTHEKVVFYLGGRRQSWREGEAWYGDFTFPHHIVNDSPISRVHLLIDVDCNDEMVALFPPRYAEGKRARAVFRDFQKNVMWYKGRLAEKASQLGKLLPTKRVS